MRKLDATKTKRLAFIKALYRLAVTQSRTTDLLSIASVLLFHDAAELLLQLAAEHLNADIPKNTPFLGYWEGISKQLEDPLPHKASMQRLNEARRALKHGGIRPDPLEIEGLRAAATNFMADTVQIVFSVRFDEISLVMLVQPDQSKLDLIEAQKLMEAEKYPDAIDRVALAFSRMMDDFEERIEQSRRRSPFQFVKTGRRMGLGRPNLYGIKDERTQRLLEEFLVSVTEDLKVIQEAMKIMALGIDYSSHVRFRSLMPVVHHLISGKYQVARTFAHPRVEANRRDVEFCIDFTVDTSIVLQESDASLGLEAKPEM